MKEKYSDLYARIRDAVESGGFVPTGGTWVEMDTNIPCGESLVRQFLFGQRFFRKEFGITCRELWIPDVFGYSGQLPQIMRGAGVRYFLTQKMSWNQFNRMPHHTFLWEGIDGTQVLTHFPPTDTYNGMATVEQILKGVREYQEHGRSNESFYVFGWGDGGGGPTAEMIERLNRMTDVDGLPRVRMRSPLEFFERLDEDAEDLAVWVGELYFETHRGTYTTQGLVKRNNRKAEILLRDIEFLGCIALARQNAEYPASYLEEFWKTVLLNQFHDIIPGSSITEVYEDSANQFTRLFAIGEPLRDKVAGEAFPEFGETGSRVAVINTLGHERQEVVELPEGAASTQTSSEGKPLGIVDAPAMGYAVLEPVADSAMSAIVSEENGVYVLENGQIRAALNHEGRLTSLFHKVLQREAVAPDAPANNFVLFEDMPYKADAWDVEVYHLEKELDFGPPKKMRVVESGPLRAAVEVEYEMGKGSRLKQTVFLDAVSPHLEFHCEVDWHETNTFLKVEFPINVRAMNATYEIQYGHVQRPTHFNTSWDLARFEVCAQRWADLSEAGFGVALLNDCKYGHATHGNVMRLSLLRSPKSPDPVADMGRHEFRYALLPHAGDFRQGDVVRRAYAFNTPLLVALTAAQPCRESFLSVDDPALVIDAVKKAEDSTDLIVRLYEAFGGRGRGRLVSSLPVRGVSRCNLLEEGDEPLTWQDGVEIEYRPFEIVTLKLALT